MPTSTAVIRESFERELVEDNRRDPNTLRRFPDGSYLYLRVQQDWLLYQRAWVAASAVHKASIPANDPLALCRAFWADVKVLESDADPQKAWAAVTKKIQDAIVAKEYSIVAGLLNTMEPEQHKIETVASALGFFIFSELGNSDFGKVVRRAQQHFANVPDCAAKVVLMTLKPQAS